MGQTPGWHRDKAKARTRLTGQVVAFARIKKMHVTVVFDGAPDQRLPDGYAVRGVKVLYAGRGSSADHRIIDVVESSTDPRGLKVVTSDRHLASLVRSLGATVVRSGEFRRQMQEVLSSPSSTEQKEHAGSDDVGEWHRCFGALPMTRMKPDGSF